MEHPWLLARCQEVQNDPNGHLDLWSREHYKSTIITFGKSIQDILSSHGDDPLPEWKGREVTIGIFSHSRPIAKKFLRQIKQEFQDNRLLKSLFPDVLYDDPEKDSPKWSEDDGIVVKRKSNPGESTVEAWGLVDGMPTSKHFFILNYDDIVTDKSVTTPEMIDKTTKALELSYNLGAKGGLRRFIGTRYHYNDSYRTLIERGTVKVRLYPGTDDGTIEGEPFLWTREEMALKRRDMGPYTFACQILQNPLADNVQGFKREWLRYYTPKGTLDDHNTYILVDPASEKRPHNDYTAMWVIKLGLDNNIRIVDIVRDRLNLTERTEKVMNLHKKWHRPGRYLEVRYEKYGLMNDIEHIKTVQADQNYFFDIVEVGGTIAKNDRIRRLVPWFEQGRIFLPDHFIYQDYEGINRDLVRIFVEDEFAPFPVLLHEDMLDGLSRLAEPDLELVWPQIVDEPDRYRDRYNREHKTTWMAR